MCVVLQWFALDVLILLQVALENENHRKEELRKEQKRKTELLRQKTTEIDAELEKVMNFNLIYIHVYYAVHLVLSTPCDGQFLGELGKVFNDFDFFQI